MTTPNLEEEDEVVKAALTILGDPNADAKDVTAASIALSETLTDWEQDFSNGTWGGTDNA